MRISKIAGFAIPLALIACGDSGTTENITNNYTTGVDVVSSAADLPKCTAENEGEQVWVKEKGSASICVDGKWESLGGSGATSVTDYGCETKPLADDRGVVIYCGGDSIGVVLNGTKGERGEQGVAGADGKDGVDGKDGAQGLQGEKGEKGDPGEAGVAGTPGKDGKDGADGKDGQNGADGVGCSILESTDETVIIRCGDDQFSMNLNGGSGEVVVPGEDVVSLAKLSGVSQKGPFINGSTVTLFELDGSRSLVQTGRTFGGEIITDDGRFSVNNVSLKSSYVRLTANGFYRNEVSGKNSTSSIVLNAYSDLQARNSVNINLLTHLEYYRVGYLMENGLESTIKASKKRAQKEIFAAFGIDNAGFGYSEDLDVFGEGDQNAALLAISILLQGDRSEADLSGLLASFGKDIEEDGKWDDKATRAKIADWAYRTSLGMNGNGMDTVTLAKLKANVKAWNLGSVPAFEKYVSNFWTTEYGIGECGADNRDEHKSLSVANSGSYKGKTLICDKIRSKNRGYFKDYEWREAIGIEKDHSHACNSDRNKLEKYAKDGYWYECDASTNTWSLTTEVKYLNQEKPGAKVGEYIDGSGETHYSSHNTADSVYEWTGSTWKLADNVGWYTHRFKDLAKTDGQYEPAKIAGTTLGVVYEGGKWRNATTIETNLTEACNATDRNKFNSVKNANAYVCDTTSGNTSKFDWRAANKFEKLANESCTYAKENVKIDKTVGSETYNFACKSAKWTGTGVVTYAGQDYNTVIIGDQYWFAKNLNYDYNEGTAKSYCYSNSSTNCDKYGRLYLWSAAMDSAAVFSDAGKGCGYGTTCAAASTGPTTVVRGVCPEGWHLPSNIDWSTLWGAIGGTSTAGTKLKSTSGWNSSGNGEDAYGFSVLPAGYYDDGSFYNAGDGGYFWSSTEYSSNNAYGKYFRYGSSFVGEGNDDKYAGFSVRCLRDSN